MRLFQVNPEISPNSPSEVRNAARASGVTVLGLYGAGLRSRSFEVVLLFASGSLAHLFRGAPTKERLQRGRAVVVGFQDLQQVDT